MEDDVRILRARGQGPVPTPASYEIEPRLKPCIDDVQGDLSYPSGHAAFGYAMAYLLSSLVPERRQALEARADEFARQRMMCGVHFRSDLEAGRSPRSCCWPTMSRDPGFRETLPPRPPSCEPRYGARVRPLQREPRAAETGAGPGGRRGPGAAWQFAPRLPVRVRSRRSRDCGWCRAA